jgi:chorismate mutase/GNAT superfamily N-acetyltransferase
VTASEVVIRRADEADAAALAAVHLTSRRAAAMPPPAHTEGEVRTWLAGRLRHDEVRLRHDEVWIAEADGAAAAYVRLSQDWVDDLYVVPERAREGIGSALLDLAKQQRPDGFCLWVFEENEAARSFYRRRGLIELEHTDGSANEERAADVRMAWPGTDPLGFLRRLIDDVDHQLGELLGRRAALTAAVQPHKPAAERDPEREREIAARMAARAPALGEERLARILHAIISESLDAAGY